MADFFQDYGLDWFRWYRLRRVNCPAPRGSTLLAIPPLFGRSLKMWVAGEAQAVTGTREIGRVGETVCGARRIMPR